MSVSEIASMVFGALGVGGGVVALYIRGTIAETIIVRLNGRYVGGLVCSERHVNLSSYLERMEHQADKIEKKVDEGFSNLYTQIQAIAASGRRIEREQTRGSG